MTDVASPYGLAHLWAVFACVVGWIVLVYRARAVRDTDGERRFRRFLGWSILLFNVGWGIFLFTPAEYDIQWSLPIQACDLGWMLSGWVMLSASGRPRLDRQVLYYWGLGLSSIAFLFPDLDMPVDSVNFYAFWLTHWQIVGVALVDLLAFGNRPTWRGFRVTVIVTAVIYLSMTLLNWKLGTSYWYSGDSLPAQPTPLDVLGSWPLRVLWVAFIAIAVFFLMTLPFARSASRQPETGD